MNSIAALRKEVFCQRPTSDGVALQIKPEKQHERLLLQINTT